MANFTRIMKKRIVALLLPLAAAAFLLTLGIVLSALGPGCVKMHAPFEVCVAT